MLKWDIPPEIWVTETLLLCNEAHLKKGKYPELEEMATVDGEAHYADNGETFIIPSPRIIDDDTAVKAIDMKGDYQGHVITDLGGIRYVIVEDPERKYQKYLPSYWSIKEDRGRPSFSEFHGVTHSVHASGSQMRALRAMNPHLTRDELLGKLREFAGEFGLEYEDDKADLGH